jgi:hypothetical protein
MSDRYAARSLRPAFLTAALTLLLTSNSIAQEPATIANRLDQSAVPSARIVPTPSALEPDFRMLVGDQSAGN